MNIKLIFLAKRVILFAFNSLVALAKSNGSQQCNLGLKLFSMESGQAICAPISPFQCVESCEWMEGNGGGCSRSSHFVAFRGRRTYLSGLVITDDSLLVQCCGSMATSTLLDASHEPVCSWSDEIQTVVDKPTIRFEHPLEESEYFRNVRITRFGRGAVKVRAEICRYGVQTTHCEKDKMSPDELRQYLLLLHRLQRTRDFLHNNGTNGKLNVGSSANLKTAFGQNIESGIDESERARAEHRTIFRNRNAPVEQLALLGRDEKRVDSSGAVLVAGEADSSGLNRTLDVFGPKRIDVNVLGRRHWGEMRAEIASTSTTMVALNEGEVADSTLNPTTRTQKTKDSLPRVIYNEPRKHLISPELLNSATQAPSPSLLDARELLYRAAKQSKMAKTTMRPNNSMLMGPRFALKRLRFPQSPEERVKNGPVPVQLSSREARLSWPKSQRRRLWPMLATNMTREMVPTRTDREWREREYSGTDLRGGQIRNGNVGAWTKESPMNAQENEESIARHPVNVVTTFSPAVRRRELSIRKLTQEGSAESSNAGWANEGQAGNRELIASGGSAGAGGSFGPEDTEPEPDAMLIAPPQFSTHPLSRAPHFKTVSLLEHKQPLGEESNAKLSHFMECCQDQAPGCRPICSRDVDKEQIKRAMSTGQCPPISMTSVIRCFPRFFNISSVSECCAERYNTSQGPFLASTSVAMPQQCLTLCSPNFQLSFAHLACVEHIEHILFCYRQLLDAIEQKSTMNSAEHGVDIPFS